MIITKIQIRHFKSFGPEGRIISLAPLTAFVGENSSGKSNVIQAIDLFRNYSKTKVSHKCFYAYDCTRPIEIRVEFGFLQDEERKLFRRHLSQDGTLTIVQRIWANEQIREAAAESLSASSELFLNPENRELASDIAIVLQHAKDERGPEIILEPVEEKTAEIMISDIDWLNEPPTARREIDRLWKQQALMVGDVDFKVWSGLNVDSPPDSDTLAQRVADFWDEHWDDIPKHAEGSGSRPLGWPSRLMGNLPEVVHIAAVRKIEEETRSAKTSPFGALLNWMIKSIQTDLKSRVRSRLAEVFSEALTDLPKDMKDLQTGEDITRLEFINQALNDCVLGGFNCKLRLDFEQPDVDSTIFGSPVLKADDGFQTDIADKGHGLQRATMLTIVRAYLNLRSQLDAKLPGLGRVIFLIEEPEIYLHPTLRRSAYELFRQLSDEGDQVIYTTHDGYLLNVLYFDEVRVTRKDHAVKPAPITCVDEVSADVLLKLWRELTEIDKISIESVRDRLYSVYDPYRNEGFLSSKVLLCEGNTERFALPVYFRAIGFDLDEHGIALIDAGSVDLLDYFYLMFTEMGIPTYALWDSDTPDETDISEVEDAKKQKSLREKSKRNQYLAKLFGMTINPREDGCYFCTTDIIADRGAVFSKKYEHTIMSILPDSEEVKGQATNLYGTHSKPLAARYYAIAAVKRGRTEGDPGKYVPDFVKQMREKLETLGMPEKQSYKLSIR